MFRKNLSFTTLSAPKPAQMPPPLPLVDIPGNFGRKARDLPNAKKRARRAEFIEAYKNNPLNFLSGTEVHKIQRAHPPKRWGFEGQKLLESKKRLQAE